MQPIERDAIRNGDRRSLARLITAIESGTDVDALIGELRDSSPAAPVIGITGPPGAGKSTLLAALIDAYRGKGKSVAILAVDPSSPLTGGALLGDRIRMQAHVEDAGVYIRSMASRGHLGGLAEAAERTVTVLAHAGFDIVFVETVGVGQSEVEVMHHVDSVVLVLTPGWGDQVQADKAGIVEVADVFVINKADLPGVEEVRRSLTQAVDGAVIQPTVATTGEGVPSLVHLLEAGFPG